jgi:uncharacterized protein YxjI
MNPLPFLDGRQRVFMRQKKEWTEILIDWETRNQYEVLGEDGDSLGRVAEHEGGFMDHVKRFFLRSHRPLDVGVFDVNGEALLRLTRNFFFIFSDLSLTTPDGNEIGSVHRRFGILYRKYDLRDIHGHTFARVRSPLWRIWTFPVKGDEGRREATISKKWGGLAREIFADADTFGIDFQEWDWTEIERTILFGAALSIDFDFFENNANSGGILGIFD